MSWFSIFTSCYFLVGMLIYHGVIDQATPKVYEQLKGIGLILIVIFFWPFFVVRGLIRWFSRETTKKT